MNKYKNQFQMYADAVKNELECAYEQGRADLIKQFDESSYMIIHVNEYGEYQPCCYTLEDISEQLKEQSDE